MCHIVLYPVHVLRKCKKKKKPISLNYDIEKEWSVLYNNAHLAYKQNDTVGQSRTPISGIPCIWPSDTLIL